MHKPASPASIPAISQDQNWQPTARQPAPMASSQSASLSMCVTYRNFLFALHTFVHDKVFRFRCKFRLCCTKEYHFDVNFVVLFRVKKNLASTCMLSFAKNPAFDVCSVLCCAAQFFRHRCECCPYNIPPPTSM